MHRGCVFTVRFHHCLQVKIEMRHLVLVLLGLEFALPEPVCAKCLHHRMDLEPIV